MVKTAGENIQGKRLFVRRIAMIIDDRTGRTVGSQMEWNTGERRLVWYGERVEAYSLHPCANVHDWPRIGRGRCRSSGMSGAT